jgi:hypothetical protein
MGHEGFSITEPFGRPLWEVISWIIFLLIIFWAIKQEYRAAKCFDGREQCGKEWAWDPHPGDQPVDLLRRLESGNRAETYVISRRLVMITAAGLSLITMWYFSKKPVPNFIEFIVPFVLIMGVIWFAFRYHESHYLSEITRRMDLSIQELKYQTGAAERPTNV